VALSAFLALADFAGVEGGAGTTTGTHRAGRGKKTEVEMASTVPKTVGFKYDKGRCMEGVDSSSSNTPCCWKLRYFSSNQRLSKRLSLPFFTGLIMGRCSFSRVFIPQKKMNSMC
jgi:hypothetical protein